MGVFTRARSLFGRLFRGSRRYVAPIEPAPVRIVMPSETKVWWDKLTDAERIAIYKANVPLEIPEMPEPPRIAPYKVVVTPYRPRAWTPEEIREGVRVTPIAQVVPAEERGVLIIDGKKYEGLGNRIEQMITIEDIENEAGLYSQLKDKGFTFGGKQESMQKQIWDWIITGK